MFEAVARMTGRGANGEWMSYPRSLGLFASVGEARSACFLDAHRMALEPSYRVRCKV